MSTAQEIRLPARGIELAGLRWNAGARICVLAVHGWLDNAATFSELAPLLPDCDLVALDLPGHGRSSHRGAGSMQHFVEYIADVAAALQALQWERVVLLGHSLGAGVMACAAGVLSDRVSALLLLEGLSPQPAEPAKIVESLRAASDAGLRGAGESTGYADIAAAIAARQKGFWPLSDAVATRILERALTRGADGVLRWHTDPRLRQPSAIRLTEEQVVALLRAVQAPTLVVGAETGLFSQFAAHEARIALLKDAGYVRLPGGHHLHLEPETAPAVAAALHEFLGRHLPA